VKLRNPDTLEAVSDVPMLLDTGSDITLLPKSFCEKISVKISDTDFLELEGFNESTSVAFYVYTEFIFLNKLFRGNFLVYEQEEGIIGRDVLNEFSLIFDGVNLEWKKQK
jgi:Aspartyl protease